MEVHMSYYDEKQYYDELVRKARLERSLALGDAIGGLAAATWHGLKRLTGAVARWVVEFKHSAALRLATERRAIARPSAKHASN
jgi:hypothetical protein